MKQYIIIFVGCKWYALNLYGQNEFLEYLPRDPINILISCQTSDLIRNLINISSNDALPQIIDLESLDKQMSQQGKEFQKDDNPWRPIKSLKYHKLVPPDYRFDKQNLKDLCEKLGALYLFLIDKAPDEMDRFNSIEVSINEIIYKRQSKGVSIDYSKAVCLCQELESEIYTIKNTLQFEYKIYDSENRHQQLAYLFSKNYSLIKSPQFSFKARRNEDEVCRLFYNMIRANQDLNIILLMLTHWGSDKKCYPSYYGFGSISSRITLREPSLQNMRKPTRSVIIANKGQQLLYVDYSQFEAGILASLSGDKTLIQLYNADIYADLAENVLGDKTKRSDAKVLFYRYIYGDETISKETKAYFKQFKGLIEYKKGIEMEILERKKVGTLVGNYRSYNEQDYNWFLSHKIQATASLIYKSAVIRVFNEVPEADFLIPMHDATLYQVETENYSLLKDKIEDIYTYEFKSSCPLINPIINSENCFC